MFEFHLMGTQNISHWQEAFNAKGMCLVNSSSKHLAL